MKGLIFNIQRFSIHDGPGIRTTVFLKGCPLSCRWCANPESRDAEPELLYTPASCIHCKSCEAACPRGGISFENGRLLQNKDVCTHCLACVSACPTHALTVEGTWYTAGQVLEEIQKDDAFYAKSSGGVTLSGGEPLMQEAFTLELLKTLKHHNYHTNIETTGYTSQEYLAQVLPFLDLVYMDLKHPDPQAHFEKTGVSNEQILKNMAFVIRQGTPLVVRIPVIPRFNHSAEAAHQYARILRDIGAKQVHLLPFHRMGLGKWHALGLSYDYENDESMREEELNEMACILTEAGLDVRIGG